MSSKKNKSSKKQLNQDKTSNEKLKSIDNSNVITDLDWIDKYQEELDNNKNKQYNNSKKTKKVKQNISKSGIKLDKVLDLEKKSEYESDSDSDSDSDSSENKNIITKTQNKIKNQSNRFGFIQSDSNSDSDSYR